MADWRRLGTARIGCDPVASAVNERGRSHDVRNLFIKDGSVFVASVGVNPTSAVRVVGRLFFLYSESDGPWPEGWTGSLVITQTS